MCVYISTGSPGGSVTKYPPAKVSSLSQEDPLEKEEANHSSILAWTIPPREEPGSVQSMGLQRVEHD